MKIMDSGLMEKFFEAVDKYEGKVELIIENNVRLNLKSTLCQFVAMGYLLEQTDLANIQIISDCATDLEKLLRFII